jgi:hypothetical protein
MQRVAGVVLLSLAVDGSCTEAFTFRPFDGNDAAETEPGQIKTDLDPAQHLRERSTGSVPDSDIALAPGESAQGRPRRDQSAVAADCRAAVGRIRLPVCTPAQ